MIVRNGWTGTLAFVVTLALQASPLSAQQRIGSVEAAVGATGQLTGRGGPASLRWIDEGRRFSYTAMNPQTRASEIHAFDPASGADEVLLELGGLRVPGTSQPLRYQSFEWTADSRHILFQTDFRPIYRHSGISDFYVYTLADRSLVLAADDARTAELSPGGRLLGYERDGDLFTFDMESGQERRLTGTGTETVWNGVFDWVYEEEFGLTQAWDWSPDGRRIAYWQTHVADVPTIQITDWEGQYPEWTVMPFPKVGQENSEVRIGVVDVESGERRLVMEERSEAWIDVFDFFAGVLHYFYFPEDAREFFWISDVDGWNHLYRYSYEGELLGQVTTGDWVVTRVEGIDTDSRSIYYTGTEESPLERHLYRIGFDGSGKQRLTREAGTHSIDMAPSTAHYVDSWSSKSEPRTVELWTTESGGRQVAVLERNEQVREWVRTHAYSPLELFSFTTSYGVELDGSLIRPPDFDPSRRYPVLVAVYGGPGSQDVYDEWASDGWHQYLAQQGYVVARLNNRGGGNYGRDFMEIVYRELGTREAQDFAALGEWLAVQPWVDGERMAIHGTSYGGYMTIMTLLRHPGVYALGIANSPATDWSLYDTIYTERYMGLLPENAEGYRAAAALTYADRLQDYLLLVHSGMDENVHPQHTMQLLTALAVAGKDAELRFYPPGAHGAAFDYASYVTMTEVYTNALCEHVATSCTPANLNN